MSRRPAMALACWMLAAAMATATAAAPPERSPRPQAGPAAEAASPLQTAQATAPAAPLSRSLHPQSRPAAAPIQQATLRMQSSTSNIAFDRWLGQFRRKAQKAGIRPDVLDAALTGLRYNTDVITRDRNQSEFTKAIWDYLDSAASDSRVRNGREALRRHRDVLDRIEARYGVDKEVVAAVWGLESAYGTYRGTTPVIEALATLGFDGRRGAFFENQLLAALRIVQAGDVAPRNMTGSWAGAMGHTQFIPTSYLAYAVDFTGDGKRDIWSDNPADALASTAAYLARFGWVKGMPWGVEVQLPRGFDYAQANRRIQRMPSDWARMGVLGVDGRAVPDYGAASILLPAGAQGAAFMIFKNFAVIERYNTADAYVIGVGHLSDRLRGGGPIRASWPRSDRVLTFAERKEMQQRLTAAGFDTKGVDGKIGPNTIAAVRAFQRSKGMAPDGYASLRILTALRP